MLYARADEVKYPKNDLVGARYGRVQVACFSGRDVGRGQARWDCVCDCGTIFTTPGYSLSSGMTKSCGCYGRQMARERVYKHGLCKSQEYRIHAGVLQRCYTESYKGYHRYGGRGIKVCDRWRGEGGFENFLADMGPRPSSGHSVNRIDNDGDYSPENCEWATKIIQARNKSNTLTAVYGGEVVSIPDLCDRFGRKQNTVRARLRDGWTIERAIETPTK